MPSLGSISPKKLLMVVFLFAILLVIPLTVYLARQQQQTQSQAAPETRLSFNPVTRNVEKNEDVSFDIKLNPGGNWVNFVKLTITYDPALLEANDQSFDINPNLNGWDFFVDTAVNASRDSLSFTISPGSDATKVIKTESVLGTLTLKAIGDPTDEPTEIAFDGDNIQIRSVVSGDNFSENVFLDGESATVSIVGETTASPTVSPTVSPTIAASATPTPTASPTASPTPGIGGTGDPVCQSLVTDVTAQGPAPLALTFTATGTDSNGTITKAAFTFENDLAEEVTTGGGIGTASVSVQLAHTFETAGTYNVTAVLTDDEDNISDENTCKTTVTVTEGEITPTIADDLGPSPALLGAGALGGLLFLIGAFLFFIL